MINIVLNPEAGITLENMPDSVFGAISGPLNNTNDGGLTFNIEDRMRMDVITEIRRFALRIGIPVSVRDQGNTLIVERGNQEEARNTGRNLADLRPYPQEDPRNTGRDYPQEYPRNTGRDTVDLDAGVDEDQREENEENNFHPHMEEVNETGDAGRVDGNAVFEAVAGVLENELSNQVKDLADRTRAFDKKWAELLAEKRAIDEITQSVSQNPVIVSLLEQVNDLRVMDNAVEDAFFTSDSIVVKTKTLITDQRIDGSLREVGRMKFKISLAAFIGSATRVETPVEIRNLDRVYHSSNESSWQCAHVPTDSSPCWGTAWEMLFSGFVQKDLHSVVETLIRFVRSPNTEDSWGGCIKSFPIYNVTNNTTEATNETAAPAGA